MAPGKQVRVYVSLILASSLCVYNVFIYTHAWINYEYTYILILKYITKDTHTKMMRVRTHTHTQNDTHMNKIDLIGTHMYLYDLAYPELHKN